MVPFYCIAEMWLFPDASRFQIKNLEAACTTCTGCCRAAPRGSYHLSCLLAALQCCSFQSSLRAKALLSWWAALISQGTVWSPECTCGWCWFLPLWHKNDSGEFKTGESMPVCADQLMYTFNRKLLLSFCSVECQSHLGKMSLLLTPKICVKLEG